MKQNQYNQRKYVYLFELDSVRKTDKEIIAGQKALYTEILENGYIVVLTFNQLIDSRTQRQGEVKCYRYLITMQVEETASD